MTLKELESLEKDHFSACEIGSCIGFRPQYIIEQARKDKESGTDSFGFPIMICKRGVKIPKEPFIKFMKGEN